LFKTLLSSILQAFILKHGDLCHLISSVDLFLEDTGLRHYSHCCMLFCPTWLTQCKFNGWENLFLRLAKVLWEFVTRSTFLSITILVPFVEVIQNHFTIIKKSQNHTLTPRKVNVTKSRNILQNVTGFSSVSHFLS
jgi:hypothetical protein